MIHGVKIKSLKMIPDERGRLMELLRSDDDLFLKFGQVYMTTAYPGVVKGWHYHQKQTDNFVVIQGMMKVVLYDDRPESPTRGQVNEFFMGDYNSMLLSIPNLVIHGFKCISQHEAILINCPTEVRIDPHNNDIPYKWDRKDG